MLIKLGRLATIIQDEPDIQADSWQADKLSKDPSQAGKRDKLRCLPGS